MPPEPMKFPKDCLIEWNRNKISDHNRSELSVDVERIENSRRMANGTLRKYVVADKRRFSVSWSDLPHSRSWTVDGFWGGQEIENFYNSNAGEFTLRVTHGDGRLESWQVVFTDFGKEITKRGEFDFWQVNVTMEEV